ECLKLIPHTKFSIWLLAAQCEIRQLNLTGARKILGNAIGNAPKDKKERARAIFELAISQPALDIPELLWKMYIDFEISERELERTRALYSD
ncbi:hypothetical protein EUTSA_v10027428mg, partial [Eutrema salsugineum]